MLAADVRIVHAAIGPDRKRERRILAVDVIPVQRRIRAQRRQYRRRQFLRDLQFAQQLLIRRRRPGT